MIDHYDVLNVGLDAEPEEIKKAFKRKSLEHHPDKVTGDAIAAAERFNEVKLARDVLEDAERRKVYDTFGSDLGEERPEMEVWSIGLTTMLSPLGGFVLQTVVIQFALWIITYKWINRILLLIGLGVTGLYSINFRYGEYQIRAPEALPILINVGVVDAVVLLYWIWPLLSDTVGVGYLVTQILPVELLLSDKKFGIGAIIGSIVFAWMSRGWWFWIIGAEATIGLILLAALTVASGIMRLWIDSVQAQRGDKIKAWRLGMRKERKGLAEENAELRRKLQGT